MIWLIKLGPSFYWRRKYQVNKYKEKAFQFGTGCIIYSFIQILGKAWTCILLDQRFLRKDFRVELRSEFQKACYRIKSFHSKAVLEFSLQKNIWNVLCL